MTLGHIVAWGASIADLLPQSRRFTGMTEKNIRFFPKGDPIRVTGGRICEIDWPSQARLHHEDVAQCQSELGTAVTSALRLGYMFRLGPIAEWIFFEGDDGHVGHAPPDGLWAHTWAAPDVDLGLGKDCRLDPEDAFRVSKTGVVHRQEGRFSAAKRCFSRCFLATLAEKGQDARAALALANLATVYLDEDRCLRALALLLCSLLVADDALPDGANDWLKSLARSAHDRIEPDLADRMVHFGGEPSRVGQPMTEILWRMEDFELRQHMQSRLRS